MHEDEQSVQWATKCDCAVGGPDAPAGDHCKKQILAGGFDELNSMVAHSA
jgi:hypothetical protein